ncbi:hypothetical protein L484_007907 [Morus notabilis]|uniref:Auxilin-related protein 2 n=1 Tax=Morus notabilis TaxID=981085 RepID=W9R0I9_9ROSA|nr:hypothetical protein L484_007907 [Morus notabilis]
MNDFEGLLASDFGFKPSKSVPMATSSSSSSTNRSNFDLGSRSARASSDDRDSIFSTAQRSHGFGGAGTKSAGSAYDFDAMFEKPSNSEPVYDKPVYDDDIFNGVAGLRSSSSSKVMYDDVFATVSSSSSPPKGGGTGSGGSALDDLLGGFGKSEPPRWTSAGAKRPEKAEKSVPDFADLLPGFGDTSPPTERSASETNWPPETSVNATKTTSTVMEDPFVVAGQFSDPLEEISKLSNSGSMKSNSVGNGRVFDDMDPFDGLVRPASSFNSERDNRGKETSTLREDSSTSGSKTFPSKEANEKPSVRSPDSQTQKKVPVDNDWDSHQTLFDMPTASNTSYKSTGQTMSPPSYASASSKDLNTQADRSPSSEENLDSSEDIWLTVSEIPLFTQPTSAPPPSRPPPPRPVSKAGISSAASTNARRKNNEFSSFPNLSQNFQAPNSVPVAARSSVVSPLDQLDDFARGGSQDNVAEHLNGISGEELEMNSVAAAMKEAMDRAEAKFRQAKEVRERESTKAAKSKEGQLERDEKATQDERVREKQEREREEKEREQRRLERERGKARQAVERATREARERAAAEARHRADRVKAERAAVDKVTAEARERAERAAVQRAQAEARERAAAEAKERAEKAAAEARERANAEAKEREARERAAATRAEAESRARAAERAAVERAAAEARERAAAEARERAAANARRNQQRNDNDLDSFFNMSNRPSSAPRPRGNSSDPFFDPPFQSRKEPEVARTSEFQFVEGESEDRRRARLERQKRTKERAEKALEEKNLRDLQIQRDQAERHRFAETLDVEIKRWAAGKDGNLRALLSTLQYVLWPECGWQPVSLTDMITGASVKKAYRKATLCIHPDKVQQKGANLQQKYIAEKVFDLLKVCNQLPLIPRQFNILYKLLRLEDML